MTTLQTEDGAEVTRTESDDSPSMQNAAITELGSVSNKTLGTFGPLFESSFGYWFGST
jgi:hypothetical protein